MSNNDAEHFKLLVLKNLKKFQMSFGNYNKNTKILTLSLSASSTINDDRLSENYGRKEDKVDWARMRKILKKEIFERLMDNWNDMWEQECLTEKLETLNKLKENTNKETTAWRPTTGVIETQRNSLYKKNLLARRDYLMKTALEKEEKVVHLKSQLLEKWKFYEETSQQITKYQSENKLLCSEINDHLEKYINLI